MKIFRVSFFGHRKVEGINIVDRKIYELICECIRRQDYVEFLVGRDGDFDQIVSSAIIRAKRNIDFGNVTHILVMPYKKAEFNNNKKAYEEYYDAVEICEKSSGAFPKAAIKIRNRCMIDRSDLCVFYVNKNNGGAWKSMKYAESVGKPYINIAAAI